MIHASLLLLPRIVAFNMLTRAVAIFSTTYGKRIGRKRADASVAKRMSDIVMIHAVGNV